VTTYHEVAGTRVDRIAGLTDALFAIALTLTVLRSACRCTQGS